MAGSDGKTLDAATLRELARLLEERIRSVEAYGAGGCPTCHDAEARAFLARLHRIVKGH